MLDIPASFGVLCVAQYNHKLFFMTIKDRIIFVLTTFFVGFLVQLPSIISASGASCVPRTRVLGLESTDRALHSHSHFAFPRIGKSTITVGSAVALTVPLVPLLFVSLIVLTDT